MIKRAGWLGGAIAILCVLAIAATAQAPKNEVRKARRDFGAAPTVEEAQTFLDDAESRLFDLGVKASRAAWVQQNFITDDTEQISADANQQANALSVELAKKAESWDKVTLPPVMARKMLLLKLAAGFPLQAIPPNRKNWLRYPQPSTEITGKGSGAQTAQTASAWT